MGNHGSKTGEVDTCSSDPLPPRKNGQSLNIHDAQQDIKIHSTVSFGLDCDHEGAMKIPLGEV